MPKTPTRRAPAPAPTAGGRFAFDGAPREWVRDYLMARVGDFTGAAEAMRQFLHRYDQQPTLERLAAGSPLERDLFVLTVAALVDELLNASVLRVELAMQRLRMVERRELVARARATARIQAIVAEEAAALGPALTEAIEQTLRRAT